MSAWLKDRLQKSIEDGFIDPLTVRRVGPDNPEGYGRYDEPGIEIIDGEQRWRVAREMKLKELPVMDLGVISDIQAREKNIQLNIRGDQASDMKLSQSVKVMLEHTSLEQFEAKMPIEQYHLQALMALEDPELVSPVEQTEPTPPKKPKTINIKCETDELHDRWRALVKRKELPVDPGIKDRQSAVLELAMRELEGKRR